MPERSILVLDQAEGPWQDFFEEFLEDTPSKATYFSDSTQAGKFLDKNGPDVLFISPPMMSLAFNQKIKLMRERQPQCRIFRLGDFPARTEFPFDDSFEEGVEYLQFQRKLTHFLPLPEKIRVYIMDDEPEIGKMLQEYLEHRINPSFEVRHFQNGQEGLEAIKQKVPDIVILDIKMPVKDGRDVYLEMAARGVKIPVIVFFDVISGNELLEMRKVGTPTIVEKGAPQSSMTDMMALIKKMVYFA